MKMYIIKTVEVKRKEKKLVEVKKVKFSKRIKIKIYAEITSRAKSEMCQVNIRIRKGASAFIPPGVYAINTECLAIANNKSWNVLSNRKLF